MSGEPIKLSTYPLNGGGWLLRCDVKEGRFEVEYDAEGDATVTWKRADFFVTPRRAATIHIPDAAAMTVLQCAANRLLEERSALSTALAAAPVSRAPALDRQHPRITRERS